MHSVTLIPRALWIPITRSIVQRVSIFVARQTDMAVDIIPQIAEAVAQPVISARDLSVRIAVVSAWVEILSPAVDGGAYGNKKWR